MLLADSWVAYPKGTVSTTLTMQGMHEDGWLEPTWRAAERLLDLGNDDITSSLRCGYFEDMVKHFGMGPNDPHIRPWIEGDDRTRKDILLAIASWLQMREDNLCAIVAALKDDQDAEVAQCAREMLAWKAANPINIRGPKLLLRDNRIVHIRRITCEDGPALRAFFEKLGAFSSRMFTPHRYDDEAIEAQIGKAVRGEDWVYVGLNSDEIVAYFFLYNVRDPAPLLGIGIADAWQDRGLGGQLMSILIEDARGLGRDEIALTTMLDNDRAYHLYLRKGFIDRGLVTHGEITERSMFLPFREGAKHPDNSGV